MKLPSIFVARWDVQFHASNGGNADRDRREEAPVLYCKRSRGLTGKISSWTVRQTRAISNDPNIPPTEIEWLREDLKATKLNTVVFTHQRLDVGAPYGIKQAKKIRSILEKSGSVKAVLMGHSHKNAYQHIGGIHYCVLRAVVEGDGKSNSGYSMLNIYADGTMRIDGFVKQTDRNFA